MPKIFPFLWFDKNAEEAMNFYCSVFKNSKVLQVHRYPEGLPMPAGTVMVCSFELEGQKFTALNGGPGHPHTDAVSFVVDCKDQAEVDYYWSKLTSDGGQEIACGWLMDKFGVRWQIWPSEVLKYLGGPDKAGAQRANAAMMQMKKLDIAKLKQAYEGK